LKITSIATKPFLRWLGLLAVAFLALQVFFTGRIAMMSWVDPQSTAFQRSEAWRVATEKGALRWREQWQPYEQISVHLKRAVIASEDDGFAYHDGVDWDALEKAWQKNAKAESLAQATAQAREQAKPQTQGNNRPGITSSKSPPAARTPRVIGGSTITQQLAKNLFLSGERNLLRKGQEFLLAFMLETLLDKERILEIYLNNVEWGEGVFGAEAAAQHYFAKPAAKLSRMEAARLAVMLPRPKYYEKNLNSGYLASRAATIAARMGGAELP
jgi:monofunctional glycosyltransferase